MPTANPAPRLFLDVDGVIAPYGGEPSYPGPVRWVSNLFYGGMHFPVEVLDGLVWLHQRGLVRIEWLTTWEEEVATALVPALGLPEWPVHTRCTAPNVDECPGASDWWKERVVVAALEAGDRAVWCDDHIQDRASHGALARYADRLLVLSPDGSIGLTAADLNRIESWVTGAPAIPVI